MLGAKSQNMQRRFLDWKYYENATKMSANDVEGMTRGA